MAYSMKPRKCKQTCEGPSIVTKGSISYYASWIRSYLQILTLSMDSDPYYLRVDSLVSAKLANPARRSFLFCKFPSEIEHFCKMDKEKDM